MARHSNGLNRETCDIIIVSASGDSGKPRPAGVIQSDWLKATDSVLVALMTSMIVEAPLYRLLLKPHAANGVKISSQIMIDKILALPRHKCGAVIGALDQSNLLALNTMLSVVIGLAD